jgi:hypothetical protein
MSDRTNVEQGEPRRGRGAAMPWSRAVLRGTVAFLVVVGLFFYIPQFLLTGLGALSRGTRAWLATGWVVLALAACGWIGWRTSTPPERTP